MDWNNLDNVPQVTAEEAVAHIKDNDLVVVAHAAGAPQLCVDALINNYEAYHNVRVFHMLTLGKGICNAPEMEGHLHHITNFIGGNMRQAMKEGRVDFFPGYFSEVPSLMAPGELLDPDVALIQVSYPNEEGYCSYGVSCDYTKPAAQNAKIVIAEMNRQMPFVGGDNLIHISKINYIVKADYPLHTIAPTEIKEVEEAIGKNCAQLVKDGDTLQLGIGAIPDAVLLFLKDKKDLGIHSEMVSDGILELVNAGVINGSRKQINPGKIVATFLMGTQALYDFVNGNDSVEMYPVDYVNDPFVIAQNDNVVSINSCVEVDLMGQVVSESIGLRQISGPGGQVDFVRGAARSKGGRSIIAMPSTASRGASSRIVPLIAEGAAVTTPRNDVDYIVTEYGIAKLKGKTLRERAKALIAIAHPQFRAELEAAYAERFEK
ncbi:acetyl-CoA hydrolase/transferase family protein [Porphyromonas levii]|uniref:Acetyl-CoA hydrolase/transferase family protein n=1 Tax=Porphyromonas levii TaxID=28114 RepID=A0A4Y8WQN5_9PORP|nr:acetyl-CoA hydrolase/transferase C-terminal domain-containing protein [Porphyromonas levii]MBR8702769.1 putative butyrate:acetyl-CoA coenzyme A-transferase [Porphyromonas levii]MBR8713623.1 putative butyrate:acetyl-CoA coenzyme A-transferase [Porphyromonas levii]MBR8715377.1 putative butyrate:acetyl-CoA coenzyme A-transferase [Porphyromonas levii]MBR8727899.1 putative butyrate:acetyl-CoA coenzyme A-transferase [Porphyromonas levii]MBR8729927.1 putative butyrate:acetyl-CoA coenzyme A-transfe